MLSLIWITPTLAAASFLPRSPLPRRLNAVVLDADGRLSWSGSALRTALLHPPPRKGAHPLRSELERTLREQIAHGETAALLLAEERPSKP